MIIEIMAQSKPNLKNNAGTDANVLDGFSDSLNNNTAGTLLMQVAVEHH